MATINIDELDSIKEPLTLTIGGSTYVVKELTRDVMQAAKDAVDRNQGDTVAMLAEQLGAFTGQPTETFIDLSLLRLQAAIAFINKAIERVAEDARKKAERSR